MAQWPVYLDEEAREDEQVEYVFGLTGGELAYESFAGYKYNYEGIPDYAGHDFPDRYGVHMQYHTVIVTGGGFLPNPAETLTDEDGVEWTLEQTYMSSGETDCPDCGAGGNGIEWWAEQFEDEHGRPPGPEDECGLCETRYKDMPGLIYIGGCYEAVYSHKEADEDEY
jgi:hypothetical protein